MTRKHQYQTLLGLLMLCVVSVAQASSQQWTFKVFLHDQEIGQHRFEVFTQDTTRYVAVEASFAVKFLFFTAYDYQHSNYEVWQRQCLQSIQSRTNDNGELQFVQGERQGDVLRVSTPEGEDKLPGCIRTFAYWDPAFLNSRFLLNAQTGELQAVQIDKLGAKTIEVRGKAVAANQYRIVTDAFSIDLWYSPQREWLALQSTTRDGAVLRYQLQ
ncbi:MAG: hypothetical protein GC149_16230 [Gammaproteobacteria bacterium]|nr:hypothetical protein [Gammaproteobacteria bacterium]